MKIFIAAYYEFLKNIRDIRMSLVFLFPILTIYILGNAVGNFFTMDVTDKIPIAYVNKDKGVIGEEFNNFLENKEIKARLEIRSYPDKDIARKAIEDGKVDGMIYLPENLTEEILKGNQAAIMLNGKENIEFIESLTSGFISSYNSINAVIATSGQPVLPKNESSMERIFFTKDASLPKMIDYYSVLTLLQMLIIGAVFGVFIVTKTPGSDIHIRIYSLPVSRWTLMVGKIIGSIGYLFLASVIVILATKYLYNANWDGNPFIILGAMLAFCAIAVGMGILVGTLVSSFPGALMIMLLLMMFFGVISGAVSPATTGGLDVLSPNYHAKILIFGAIYGYSRDVMMESALWLGAFITIIYGLSAILIGRVKYDNI